MTNDSTSAPGSNDIFATTQWTVVLAASLATGDSAALALEELCRNYWFPLYAYARHQGHSKEDAEDLTQAFFSKLLEKSYLSGLSSEKGKFRAFLLASFKHFLSNEWDHATRQKRGGCVAPLSLDWFQADSQYQFALADTMSPDRLYDRSWAMTLLARVLGRLRQESEGKEALFDGLKPFLTCGTNVIPYSEAATRLGLTEGAVRVAVHRLRGRYRDLLREEIRQTLADPSQVDEEMRALFSAFAH